nr:hypothetical protein [Tanacetum cinerariifolium]
MNEVYYYGQNSCYDSTSIGFDQSQPQQYTVDHPIFNDHNSYLDSQIQLNSTLAKIKDQMTSIPSLCEMACKVIQKKLEEKQIEEERAAKAKYQIEDFSKSNEKFSSINDDSFSIDDIDYVEASPPDSKLVSSEVMEIVIPE